MDDRCEPESEGDSVYSLLLNTLALVEDKKDDPEVIKAAEKLMADLK